MSRSGRVGAPLGVRASLRDVPLPPPPAGAGPGTVHWRDTDLDDAEIVRRACDRDVWARAALYHRYAREIGNLAVRLLRDRDVAADVVQDTFVTAFETIHTLRDPDRVRGWLRMIAIRHAHRRFRRRRMLRMLGIVAAPRAVALEDLALEDASQEARVQLRRIDAALATLPGRARLVWTLRMVEGETLPDIAAACRISLATVKRDFTAADSVVRRAVEEADDV